MASSYQQKFPVPDGFPEILHDLMKAVLREQPSDIVEYSYQYFENMSKGLGEPMAERKNYYGNQMEIQKEAGVSEVISKPSGKATPDKEESHIRQPSAQSRPKSQITEGKSVTTNQTHKGVGTTYVGDLADKAIEIYEGEFDAQKSP